MSKTLPLLLLHAAAGGWSLTPSQPPVQWLVFTASWCGPCQAARADYGPWLTESGWRVGESRNSHVWIVDGDRHAQSVIDWKVSSYPTFVLVRGGKEIKRHYGYPGRQVLVDEYLVESKQ